MLISIIKSCIINPLNTLTLYSLSTLSSLYPRLKKRRMMKFLMRSLAYWGILVIEAASRTSKVFPKDGIQLQRLVRVSTIGLAWNCISVHTSTGATPPPSLSIQHKGSASHGRSESRQWKFQWKLSLIEWKSDTTVCRGQLYQKVEANFD